MDNFALDLSSLIVHLEYQRKRVLENPYTSNRMCYCRTEILNRYVNTLQKFLVRLSARTLKFFDDYNYAVTTNMVDLKTWFFAEIYDQLYNHPRVSNKMILFFNIIQRNMDDHFFNMIDMKYRELIRKHDTSEHENYGAVLDELFDEIRAWFEIFVFNILAVQLNCQSIKNTIFLDFEVPQDFMCCGEKNTIVDRRCDECPLNKNRERGCQAVCGVHAGVQTNGENIVIVVADVLMNNDSWLRNLFQAVEKYHTNPENIHFELDFRMYDPNRKFLFTREMKTIVELSRSLFGEVSITNWTNAVDFNLYHECLSPLLR